MIVEHALTYNNKLSASNIEYLTTKANRLGRIGKQLMRVYSQEDAEGTHIYFEVQNSSPTSPKAA